MSSLGTLGPSVRTVMISPQDHQRAITNLLGKLQKERFWGDVIIRIKDGNVVLYEKHETIKPESLVHTEDVVV